MVLKSLTVMLQQNNSLLMCHSCYYYHHCHTTTTTTTTIAIGTLLLLLCGSNSGSRCAIYIKLWCPNCIKLSAAVLFAFIKHRISVAWCKTAVSPLPTQSCSKPSIEHYYLSNIWMRATLFCIKPWLALYFHIDDAMFVRTHVTVKFCMYRGPGLGVTKQKSMLNSMLVNKDFLTWLLIGWQLCCQPIRCQVWKSLLTNMDFNM